MLEASQLEGTHMKLDVVLIDDASVYPLQHPPRGGESHVYRFESVMCVEQMGCSTAQNAGGDGTPPDIGNVQLHGGVGAEGGSSAVQKVGGGEGPSIGMVHVQVEGGDAGGSDSRSWKLSQLEGEYGDGGGDDGGGMEGGGGTSGGGVDGEGGGASQSGMSMGEYPLNMKLRPVVQHSVMAKRTRNELTPSSLMSSDRLVCSGVSACVPTGLSWPMPTLDACVMGESHASR